LLQEKHSVTQLGLSTGVDITDPTSLSIIKDDTEHEVVLHLAAKADVDGCELDKAAGEEGSAYKINVLGAKNVADACKVSGKKMLYVSTDFVFDGSAKTAYVETDMPHPINWYGMTKYKGEEMVKNSGVVYTILRIAYPYRNDAFALKKDFMHAIKERLANNQPVAAITDHNMTPTHIDDIAEATNAIIENNASGIYHIVGSQSLSPYDAAVLIAERFGYQQELISRTTRAEYFKGKAVRPFNLSLNNDKIKQLGVTMRTFEKGLEDIQD
jgi:dTDP-4-dehydrorhamnose reductase